MKLVRSSLAIAAATFAAACGDKVSVTQPSAKIESVAISPSTATLSIGQSVTLTASVSADAGVNATVAWSSGSAAATVTSAGVVTAAQASPGVAVCATASAPNVASVENCATIIVQPSAPTVPAVLQIASITAAGNLNAPVPVPPAAVAGQINVSVNLNPGTEKMDSVAVMVNGISAGTQTFSNAQAAALRAATGSAADQALQATLVFSINTAAYASAGCATQVAPCGTPTYLNGPAAISVVGYGHQGAAAVTNATSQGVSLLFGNPDSWIVAQTLGAGTAAALDANGFNYNGGASASVAVTAVPVGYSGLAIASANVNFGTTACDASGSAQRVQPLTAPVAPSRAWTATFARTAGATAHAKDVNNYEFSSAACPAANAGGGEGAAIASAQYANTAAPTGFAFGSPVPVVRLDNRAPGTPSLMQNPRIRENGWINAQVGLNAYNAGTSTTADNVVVAGTADGGVGGTTAWLRVAAAGAAKTVDAALAATATNSAPVGTGLLAPSATGTAYCGVWTSRDALGNETPLPAAGTACSPTVPVANTALAATHMLFGVDIAPPTVAMSDAGLIASSAGANASLGIRVAGEFLVIAADTGVIGNSGIPTSGLIATVVIRSPTPGLTAAQLCPVGTVVNGVCTASTVGTASLGTTTINLSSIIGYYTFTGQSVDAAGNVSVGVATRVRAYEPGVAPVMSPVSYTPPLTGNTATVQTSIIDNFDLWRTHYQARYGGGPVPLMFPSITLNTFNTAPFVMGPAPTSITLNGFMRQIEIVAGNSPLVLVPAPPAKLSSIEGTVFDMVGLQSTTVTPIPPGSVTTGVSYVDAGAFPAPQLTDSWALTNTVASVSTGAGPGAPVNPLSVTLTAVLHGPTGTYGNPFSAVYFYDQTAFGLEPIGVARTYSVSDDGSPQGRAYTYTFVWTPGTTSTSTLTLWPLGLQTLYAVGVSTNGDGLFALGGASVNLTNP